MGLTKISTDGVKDDAVTTDKLANAINTERTGKIANVVEDTSPQLGGDLASNGSDIVFAGTDKAKFGTDKLAIYHDGNHSLIEETGTGNLFLKTTGSEIAFLGDGGSDYMVRGIQNGAVELYHNANKKLETASDKILFYGHAKVNSDNAYDLGAGGARWKDLYLSGGLFVGGTGSANELDDYEQGTYTPSVSSGVGGGSISYNSRSGRYTKIGNLVHFTFHMNIASVTLDSGSLKFGGLPFTVEANDSNKAGAAFKIWTNGNLPEDCTFRCESSDTQILVISAAGDAVVANSTSLNAGNRAVALAGFYYT